MGVEDGERAPRELRSIVGGARMARAACRLGCTSGGGVHVARTGGRAGVLGGAHNDQKTKVGAVMFHN